MSRPSAALSVALTASLAAAAPVFAASPLAGSAPQVSLGRLEPLFLNIRPYALVVLVAYALWVSVEVVARRLHAARPKEGAGANGSLVGLLHTQFYIGLLIVIAVVILYAGIDLINAGLSFVWTVFA